MTSAEHAAILAADPEYQERMRKIEEARAAHFRKLNEEEEPLRADLRAVGWSVNSAWDLIDRTDDYSAAFPVLVEHLKRPYHERNLEGMARALIDPRAFDVAWDTVYDLFVANATTETLSLEYPLALALAQYTRESVLDQILGLVTDTRYGDNRTPLVRVLAEYRDRDDVRRTLESLVDDPDVGKEAGRALSARRVRKRRLPPGVR